MNTFLDGSWRDRLAASQPYLLEAAVAAVASAFKVLVKCLLNTSCPLILL